MGYKRLTTSHRYQISALRRNGCTMREIGALIDRDKSSVSRELRHKLGRRGYRPKQAHETALARCSSANAANVRKIPQETWKRAHALLRKACSPEQVSGRLKRLEGSPETLYQRIYADKAAGGDLHRHLRSQKKRRKRYGSGQQRRGKIPHCVGIRKRPVSVEARFRVGHWRQRHGV